MSVHFSRLAAVLFPSWNFFTDETGKPELMHRWLAAEGAEPGAWMRTLPQARRSWRTTLFSPAENLRYAVQSTVERSLAEDSSAQRISLILIRDAVRYFVRRNGESGPAGAALQFMVRVPETGREFLSEPFGLGEEGSA